MLKINSRNSAEMITANLQKADVAIEFTSPHSAVQNIKKCLDAGLPVVSGSTGWLQQWDEIKQYCEAEKWRISVCQQFQYWRQSFF